ncbi:hypothetical protein [Aliamphritea spongicola]|nr:hypothetical protein [Aliamphritea spongicola]
MNQAGQTELSWRESFKIFVQPKVLAMLLLGFSAGLPILLIFHLYPCGCVKPVWNVTP